MDICTFLVATHHGRSWRVHATVVVVSLVTFPSLLIGFDASLADEETFTGRLQCKWAEATFHQVHFKCQADICRLRGCRLDRQGMSLIGVETYNLWHSAKQLDLWAFLSEMGFVGLTTVKKNNRNSSNWWARKAFKLDWYQNHYVFMTDQRQTAVTASPLTPLWIGGNKKICKLNKSTRGAMCHVLAMVGWWAESGWWQAFQSSLMSARIMEAGWKLEVEQLLFVKLPNSSQRNHCHIKAPLIVTSGRM